MAGLMAIRGAGSKRSCGSCALECRGGFCPTPSLLGRRCTRELSQLDAQRTVVADSVGLSKRAGLRAVGAGDGALLSQSLHHDSTGLRFLGIPLSLILTGANVSDRDQCRPLLQTHLQTARSPHREPRCWSQSLPRIDTRCEKLHATFAAMNTLVAIVVWLTP